MQLIPGYIPKGCSIHNNAGMDGILFNSVSDADTTSSVYSPICLEDGDAAWIGSSGAKNNSLNTVVALAAASGAVLGFLAVAARTYYRKSPGSEPLLVGA